jgi:hypothetical protein
MRVIDFFRGYDDEIWIIRSRCVVVGAWEVGKVMCWPRVSMMMKAWGISEPC